MIRIDVYHHVESSSAIDRRLDEIVGLLQRILVKEAAMSAELDTLTTQVQNTNDVEQSAIVLLNGLSAQIASLKTDPKALQALADSLGAKSSELAAAVTANTPAA